jgi:hypothetical protein
MGERQSLIETGRRWVEHAPPAVQSAEGLVGFRGVLFVCVKCSSRICGRGCDLKKLADIPVWEPETIVCDLCEGKR